jgi:hypothetical protein
MGHRHTKEVFFFFFGDDDIGSSSNTQGESYGDNEELRTTHIDVHTSDAQ